MPEETHTPQATGLTIRAGGCGGCTLCCKVMSVPAIDKAAGVWCPHCKTGAGCGIYDTRPGACADFMCGFLTTPSLGEEWRPATSRLIIDTQKEQGTIADVYTSEGAEFVRFVSGDGPVEIRLDHIISFKEA